MMVLLTVGIVLIIFRRSDNLTLTKRKSRPRTVFSCEANVITWPVLRHFTIVVNLVIKRLRMMLNSRSWSSRSWTQWTRRWVYNDMIGSCYNRVAVDGNENVPKIIINNTTKLSFLTAISILAISNRDSFRVLFDEIDSVYFVWKIYLYFSIGIGQPREPALCQLYRHTFVPYCSLSADVGRHRRSFRGAWGP